MASHAVALRGEPIVDEQNAASEAITPGMLCEVNQPALGQIRKHATAGGNAAPTFAMERDEMGQGLDVPYAIGDRVKLGRFSVGMGVNGLLAAGQTCTGKEFLESNGDGTMRVAVTDASTDDTQRRGIVAKSAESTGGATGGVTRHRMTIV
jgi:hypothetical protein